MIKAVFFDLYFTLIHYDPPQEEIESGMLRNFGIDVSAEKLRLPIIAANDFMYKELIKRPLNQRTKEETMALYMQYQRNVLKDAGIQADENVVMGLLGGMTKAKMNLVLYGDALPSIDELKKRGLAVGLISNVERDMSVTLDSLGLTKRLDAVVTSLDAGANKPRPEIFQYALKKTGTPPAQAIYVGDQYQVDVVGAKSAGMKGILLDRDSQHEDITDCPRIKSLAEITAHL